MADTMTLEQVRSNMRDAMNSVLKDDTRRMVVDWYNAIDAAIKQRERDAKDGEDSKDGARYRHMIETSLFMCFGASEYRCKADLDEAIDAAMAKESGDG